MPSSHITPWTRLAIVAALLLTVGMVGAFAWPTRWRFEKVNGAMIRIERSSGRAWVLDPERGWTAIPDSAPTPNPLNALPDLPTHRP